MERTLCTLDGEYSLVRRKSHPLTNVDKNKIGFEEQFHATGIAIGSGDNFLFLICN